MKKCHVVCDLFLQMSTLSVWVIQLHVTQCECWLIDLQVLHSAGVYIYISYIYSNETVDVVPCYYTPVHSFTEA